MSIVTRCLSVIIMLLLIGCGSGPRGERLFEPNPVTGVVHIDGQPAQYVQVDCYPASESTAIKYKLSTMTNQDGRFELTTYESGDGLPEGTYKLTFQWLEIGLVSYDKFEGAYADPEKSQNTITVVKGESSDLGIIELSSSGPS
ncbi:MAG: hypothetical protein KDA93_21695 [Planctomycetaceae bacterium]|nr:hypothetical protein [Planctomycetaceae bacterium]